jgi:DNA-directed RNA polymerase subunit RPC12/RpoP
MASDALPADDHAKAAATGADAPEADALADYLRTRDVPCPACGYNLRGVTTGACPECGLRVTMRVAEYAPHSAYWYAALSAVAWPALFDGLFAVLWLEYAVQSALAGRLTRDVVLSEGAVPVVAAAACAAVLVFLVRTRHRPWRPRTRRLVLLALWMIFAIHAFWLAPVFVRHLFAG